ncbi:MAG: hypothetical protein EHM39_10415 [Chloroflexi bacterium]|nr:MAG: hypothetical protein EHM39_10415 [Chloroflexota bacterium]
MTTILAGAALASQLIAYKAKIVVILSTARARTLARSCWPPVAEPSPLAGVRLFSSRAPRRARRIGTSFFVVV